MSPKRITQETDEFLLDRDLSAPPVSKDVLTPVSSYGKARYVLIQDANTLDAEYYRSRLLAIIHEFFQNRMQTPHEVAKDVLDILNNTSELIFTKLQFEFIKYAVEENDRDLFALGLGGVDPIVFMVWAYDYLDQEDHLISEIEAKRTLAIKDYNKTLKTISKLKEYDFKLNILTKTFTKTFKVKDFVNFIKLRNDTPFTTFNYWRNDENQQKELQEINNAFDQLKDDTVDHIERLREKRPHIRSFEKIRHSEQQCENNYSLNHIKRKIKDYRQLYKHLKQIFSGKQGDLTFRIFKSYDGIEGISKIKKGMYLYFTDSKHHERRGRWDSESWENYGRVKNGDKWYDFDLRYKLFEVLRKTRTKVFLKQLTKGRSYYYAKIEETPINLVINSNRQYFAHTLIPFESKQLSNFITEKEDSKVKPTYSSLGGFFGSSKETTTHEMGIEPVERPIPIKVVTKGYSLAEIKHFMKNFLEGKTVKPKRKEEKFINAIKELFELKNGVFTARLKTNSMNKYFDASQQSTVFHFDK